MAAKKLFSLLFPPRSVIKLPFDTEEMLILLRSGLAVVNKYSPSFGSYI